MTEQTPVERAAAELTPMVRLLLSTPRGYTQDQIDEHSAAVAKGMVRRLASAGVDLLATPERDAKIRAEERKRGPRFQPARRDGREHAARGGVMTEQTPDGRAAAELTPRVLLLLATPRGYTQDQIDEHSAAVAKGMVRRLASAGVDLLATPERDAKIRAEERERIAK